MNGQPPDEASHIGQSPASRIVHSKRALGEGGDAPVVRDRLHPGGRTPLQTVVERSQFVAVEIQPVNHTAVEIGDEKLTVFDVESDVAQGGSSVGDAPIFEIGKKAHLSAATVDLPDRSGRSSRSELPRHEAGTGRSLFDGFRKTVTVLIGDDDVQSIGAGGGEVDVGRDGVVQGDAEDLADRCRRQSKENRRAYKLPLGRSEIGEIENFYHGTLRIDRKIRPLLSGSGESCDDGTPRFQDICAEVPTPSAHQEQHRYEEALEFFHYSFSSFLKL